MPSWFKPIAVSDIMDMLLVGTLVYGLLLWFKRTKAAFVALGLLMAVIVYAVALISDMYMTVRIFQGFFAVFIVAVIIIFQEEIRSMFERIAIWSLTGGVLKTAPTHRQVEILVSSLGDLARENIGALVVLRGLDPLDRHVEGGWYLNGDLSEALIKSIFDSHSLGHDGAFIVEEGRVSRFGVRLPLSKDFAKTTNLGTRHAAALGLSERCDAMCLVVSEETGNISFALRGCLAAVVDLEELQGGIQIFLTKHLPKTPQNRMYSFVTEYMREKLIAGAVSILLWVFFVGFGGHR